MEKKKILSNNYIAYSNGEIEKVNGGRKRWRNNFYFK